jgi:arsenate reductase
MAEGILRHLAGDRFEVFSAGTEPKGLAPATVTVMREAGIDVASHRSKSIQEFFDKTLDYVITLCHASRASCPSPPSSRTLQTLGHH